MNRTVDDQIYELHASICQVLANPTRLKVLNALREDEVAVTELARRVGTSVPNLSRHLAILKAKRIVVARREGVTVYYRLANLKTLRACDIMREVLLEYLADDQRLYVASGAASQREVERTGGKL
ncbi:MAG: winged helix-turn-helix transcriptional regulator [Candidatus Rokubacteria bacterium]|nr:winged helix-turn-helix transcriptional regulator [Candidatus Rokubacteria bacterium]